MMFSVLTHVTIGIGKINVMIHRRNIISSWNVESPMLIFSIPLKLHEMVEHVNPRPSGEHELSVLAFVLVNVI